MSSCLRPNLMLNGSSHQTLILLTVRVICLEQVKMPKTVQFKSIRDSLVEPEFVTSDFAKMDRERQLLVGMQVQMH